MRITEQNALRSILANMTDNQSRIAKFQNQVTSGLRVTNPGDDASVAGSISDLRSTLDRLDSHKKRISSVKSTLTTQDDLMNQANEIMVRLKEVATQSANETNGPTERAILAAEVFRLRDDLVSIANTKFQGRYIYGGADDDDPPYDAGSYSNSATASGGRRYIFDGDAGTDQTRTVEVTDNLTININSRGDTLFREAIGMSERLGRALEGFRSSPTNASYVPTGFPDGGGTAYTFPTDSQEQTATIQVLITELDDIRTSVILPERTDLGARMNRVESAEKLVESLKVNITEVLDRIQNADLTEAATSLSLAQTALQASYQVTSRLLNLNIMQFL